MLIIQLPRVAGVKSTAITPLPITLDCKFGTNARWRTEKVVTDVETGTFEADILYPLDEAGIQVSPPN